MSLDLEGLTALVNSWFKMQPEIPGGISVLVTIQSNGVRAVATATDPTNKLLMRVIDFFEESLPKGPLKRRVCNVIHNWGYADMDMAKFLKEATLQDLSFAPNTGDKTITALTDALAREGWSLKKRR
jgi:DNA-binding IscR family transcriptional regulator